MEDTSKYIGEHFKRINRERDKQYLYIAAMLVLAVIMLAGFNN